MIRQLPNCKLCWVSQEPLAQFTVMLANVISSCFILDLRNSAKFCHKLSSSGNWQAFFAAFELQKKKKNILQKSVVNSCNNRTESTTVRGTRCMRHLLPISKQSPPAASLFFVPFSRWFFSLPLSLFLFDQLCALLFCGPNQLRIPKCDCDCEWQRAFPQCESSVLSCPVLPASLMTADRPFAIQINLWLTNV